MTTAGRGSGVRERVLRAARTQLREAANDALASALDALQARVAPGLAGGGRARSGRQLERMREVLERDRALVSAATPHEPPRPSAAPPECDEPIRTRSMAKLLAVQGHAQRALAIYAYLLARDGNDPALQAEAAALREAQLRSPGQDE